jgi:hypothetical protein
MRNYVNTFKSFSINEGASVVRVNPDDENYQKVVEKNCPIYTVTKEDVDSTYNHRKEIVRKVLQENRKKIEKMSGAAYASKFDEIIDRVEAEIEGTILEVSTKWLMANNALSGKFYEEPYQKRVIEFIYKEMMGAIEGNWLYKQALRMSIDEDNIENLVKQVNRLFDNLEGLYRRTRRNCTRSAQNMIKGMAPKCQAVVNAKDRKPVPCPTRERADLIVTADIGDSLEGYKKRIIEKLRSYV